MCQIDQSFPEFYFHLLNITTTYSPRRVFLAHREYSRNYFSVEDASILELMFKRTQVTIIETIEKNNRKNENASKQNNSSKIS